MAAIDYGTVLQFTGNGSTTVYQVSFDILAAGDVCVMVDRTPVAFTFNDATNAVTLDTAPADGSDVVVYREVNRSALDHTFADRNVLRNANLDANFLRLIYAAQEMADRERTGVQVPEPVTSYNDLEDVPTEFTPAAHTHTEADITDLDKYTQAAVDALLAVRDGRLDAVEAIDVIQNNRLDALEAGGSGESNTASNEGVGEGLALAKDGVNLPFKTLVAGANVTLTAGAETLTIAASGEGGGGGEANTTSNAGSGEGLAKAKVGVDLPLKSLTAGSGIELTGTADEVEISTTGGSGTGRHEIETITDPVSGDFVFDNIPQGYRNLYADGYVYSAASGTSEVVFSYLNDDETNGNYFFTQTLFRNTGSPAITEGPTPDIARISRDGPEAGAYLRIRIPLYSETYRKFLTADSEMYVTNGSEIRAYVNKVWHDSLTAAITKLKLTSENGDTLLGTLTLYGEY